MKSSLKPLFLRPFGMITLGVVSIGALFLSAPSWAALNARLTVKGAVQGEFKGSGPEGAIEIETFTESFSRPVDPANGLASGRGTQSAFTFTKAMDGSSESFLQAQSTNEKLTTVVLRLYKAAPNGTQMNDFTYTLTNATVTGYTVTGGPSGDTETISLVFQKLQLTDEANRKTVVIDAPHNAAEIANLANAIGIQPEHEVIGSMSRALGISE